MDSGSQHAQGDWSWESALPSGVFLARSVTGVHEPMAAASATAVQLLLKGCMRVRLFLKVLTLRLLWLNEPIASQSKVPKQIISMP